MQGEKAVDKYAITNEKLYNYARTVHTFAAYESFSGIMVADPKFDAAIRNDVFLEY